MTVKAPINLPVGVYVRKGAEIKGKVVALMNETIASIMYNASMLNSHHNYCYFS